MFRLDENVLLETFTFLKYGTREGFTHIENVAHLNPKVYRQ